MVYVIIILMVFSRFFRCFVLNIHIVVLYLVKDIIDYIVHQKWKIWNGYGLNIYVGMFGKGKTLTASNYVISQAKKYKLNVLSNIKLIGVEYTPLINYQQIIDSPNNTIILVDEVSTLFNARGWKDFNVNLLFQLLQCRKNKKQLICTAQRFNHVDKLLRDITTYVVDCNKYWRFMHTVYYDAWDFENAMNKNLIISVARRWNFITNKWYSNYDTSELIDNAKKTDFLSNEEIMQKQGNVYYAPTNANLSKKGKKILSLKK